MAGVFRTLGKGIGDLSQLQVQTFTGDLTAFIDNTAGDDADSAGGKKTLIKWQELLKNAKEKGEVSIVAATKVNIDGDTELFISETASATVLEAHHRAVLAAQQVRQGLLEAFSDVLGI